MFKVADRWSKPSSSPHWSKAYAFIHAANWRFELNVELLLRIFCLTSSPSNPSWFLAYNNRAVAQQAGGISKCNTSAPQPFPGGRWWWGGGHCPNRVGNKLWGRLLFKGSWLLVESCVGTNKVLPQLVDLADICCIRCCFIDWGRVWLKVNLSKAVIPSIGCQPTWLFLSSKPGWFNSISVTCF